MSWLETDIPPILEMLGVWIAVGLAVVTVAITSARLMSAEHEVKRLQREVAVFAEASTRVADTLDQLLLGNVAATGVSHTSRRYLLSEATAGLESGESLDSLSERLGLSHDEVRLLQRTQRTLGAHGVQQAA